MNQQLLLTFLDVTETRNFNRTAERLNITQSTVSARIRQLEDSLDVRLFVRGRGGAEPTASGRRFENHARALLSLWGHARRDMQTSANAHSRRLHVSCQHSFVRSYLLDWTERLCSEIKNLNLHVEINFSEQIQRDILAGETDIGIMFAPRILPDLQIGDLGAAEFVMVSTTASCLAEVKKEHYIKAVYTTYLERVHDDVVPHLAYTQLVIGSEDLGIELLSRQGGTLYLPRFALQQAQSRIDLLRIVSDAPVLLQPVFTVVSSRKRQNPLVVSALKYLHEIIKNQDQST